MPSTTELPGNLKLLARRNALQVDHQSFNVDTQRLISQLELALDSTGKVHEKSKKEDKEVHGGIIDHVTLSAEKKTANLKNTSIGKPIWLSVGIGGIAILIFACLVLVAHICIR